eukprot:TRINITY_DN26416_c0_g1_i2.p1 TRINITY_DN26416_c0_g1~~TRINITY_DN26416_c0_g1_i2.p1  ORF type:complete len:228 (+),score=50.33 TRINITY_DN26416_c0_g1_i2:191-874(+)
MEHCRVALGQAQVSTLNQMLRSNGTLEKLLVGDLGMGGEFPTTLSSSPPPDPPVFISPLRRTTQTALGVFEGINIRENQLIAMEFLRESTEGGHCCDARRSVSDPPTGTVGFICNNCTFSQGYKSLFSSSERLRYEQMINGQGLGMFSDEDELFFQAHPESHNLVEIRAAGFVQSLYLNFPDEQYVFAVAHGGIISAILQSVGLKGYSAGNAELIPVMIRSHRHSSY